MVDIGNKLYDLLLCSERSLLTSTEFQLFSYTNYRTIAGWVTPAAVVHERHSTRRTSPSNNSAYSSAFSISHRIGCRDKTPLCRDVDPT